MSAAAFDTLRIARDLEAVGIERRQAEAHAEALRSVAQSARAESATKADLEAAVAGLEVRLRSDLATKADLEAAVAEIRTATKTDLAAVRSELGTVRWAIGLLAAFVFAIGLRLFGLI